MRMSPTAVSGVIACVLVGGTAMAMSPRAAAEPEPRPDVRISEVANGGPGGGVDEYIEIANFGDRPAELDGWGIYSCSTSAGRNGDPIVPLLTDVTLAPGQTYVVAHPDSTVAGTADEVFLSGFGLPDTGTGAYLADDQRRLVDAIAIYSAQTVSDCGLVHLPNDLDYARGQSYQRVEISGATSDFVKADRTPGAPNAHKPDAGVQPGGVLISELTNGGPAGDDDDFIELVNAGEAPVDISGWDVYRCSETGRRLSSYLQATVPVGTVLAPGEVFVAAHDSVDLPPEVPQARYGTAVANLGFGALIEDPDGTVRDAVGVYETDGYHQRPTDSPCTQGTALPNRLDYGFGESYQRYRDTADNARDFLRAPRTPGEHIDLDPSDFPEPLSELPDADLESDPFTFGDVRISEFAHSGPAGHIDTFVELGNVGDKPVSLAGWSMHHCADDGRRQIAPMVADLGDVVLAPGDTYLAVRAGSPLHQAGEYDVTYTVDLSGQSQGSGLLKTVNYGLILYDAADKAVDSAGVDTSGTEAVTPYNFCAKGIFLSNVVDTELGDSEQRFQATGVDAHDFVHAPRSPGELPADLRHPADLSPEELAPVDVPPAARPLPPTVVTPANGASDVPVDTDLAVTGEHSTGDQVAVTFYGAQRITVDARGTKAFTGVSDKTPPAERQPGGERRVPDRDVPLEGGTDPLVSAATEGFPYQRYELLVRDRLVGNDLEIVWSGRSVGRNELQMYAWNHRTRVWQLLDAAGGLAGEEITLVGRASAAEVVRGRTVTVLVQDGPATRERFTDDATEPNLAFKDPAEYDFSLGFMSDTQWITEGFRDVYASMNRWLVTNQDARDIAYTFHTGDLMEKWTRQVDVEGRAREQFQFASDVMKLLEEAKHPHGVVPGNHDNITGRSNELFNEYFPVDRYDHQPWWGDSWRPADNLNHYDVIEVGGAPFLMLHLGYFGGPCSWQQATREAQAWCADKSPDETIAWANDVLADHEDHNVIVATHNYLTSGGLLASPDTSRWNEIAYRYWEEVILPNDNVFMVLSGHNQAVALNIKRDVGGVEGRVVVEMMADYAGHLWNGRRNVGFLRLLQIDVDAKKMAVNSYSPWLEEHNAWEYDRFDRYDDADDEFTLDIDINDIYDKRVETSLLSLATPAADLGTVEVAAGENAVLSWSGLEKRRAYHWWTEGRDVSGGDARSAAQMFTTRR